MIVTVKSNADACAVERELVSRGLWVERMEGDGRIHFLVESHSSAVAREEIANIAGVDSVATRNPQHPRIDAQARSVQVGDISIGPDLRPVLMAGPCSVESPEQLDEIAQALSDLGVQFLRGGAFKPRTSPYSFQGHGFKALEWLRATADRYHLKVVTEALAAEHVDAVAAVADLVQIGSRNMHNYALLRTIAATGRPVLLKRGIAATLEEWLLAGEYCLLNGSAGVIFCERGIRGFDPSTRNLLDFGAVAVLSAVHHQPVIVDPSHGAGRRDVILPLSRAALAAGASGLLLEVHAHPENALSDGPQALLPAELARSLSLLKGPELGNA
jgi:3-deoxy-7-phosphoheptulonate synthase